MSARSVAVFIVYAVSYAGLILLAWLLDMDLTALVAAVALYVGLDALSVGKKASR